MPTAAGFTPDGYKPWEIRECLTSTTLFHTHGTAFSHQEYFETMIRMTLIQILTCAMFSGTIPSPSLATEPAADWQFTDIEGQRHAPFDDESTRGIVLIFISADCPIANTYQPLLQRLAEAHVKSGIRFFMIHPNREITVDQARQHASEFKITVPVVIDGEQSISRRVGATVTPQAFVFVRDQPTPCYQGRIDNLYVGYGKKRNVATTHELADALDSVVAGSPVKRSRTTAVGCFISYTSRAK
jgi:hypothetical protein